jgi:hypothetical protein
MNFNYNEYLEKARDLANQAYDQGVKALSKTETERKLADALSHANWGASTTQMADIAQATNDTQEYTVVMREVWAAIGEKPRNWRVVYKGLALLEFLLKHGSERCVREARDFKARVRGLETFSYSASGAEKGTGVREKARAIIELLSDADLLDTERRDAAKLRSKFTGVGRDGASVGPTGGTSTGGFGDVALSGARGAKLDSDSDDEYMAEQKRKMKKQQQQRKAGGGQEEQGEEDEEQDFGYNKPGKKNEDEDDFGFSSDEDKKPKPKAKKVGCRHLRSGRGSRLTPARRRPAPNRRRPRTTRTTLAFPGTTPSQHPRRRPRPRLRGTTRTISASTTSPRWRLSRRGPLPTFPSRSPWVTTTRRSPPPPSSCSRPGRKSTCSPRPLPPP